MATISNSTCSESMLISSSENDVSSSSSSLNRYLTKQDDKFYWKGDLATLQQFVNKIVNLQGKWTSPGGDAKLFTSDECVLKWSGWKKMKITIKSDTNNLLLNALENNHTQKFQQQSEDATTTTPEADGAILSSSTTSASTKDEVKGKVSEDQAPINSEMLQKFSSLEAKIAELERKHLHSDDDYKSRCERLEATVESLLSAKKEMNNQLQSQQSLINELTEDNEALKQILDVKQREWITIEHNTGSDRETTSTNNNDTMASQLIATSNRFSLLHVEGEAQSDEQDDDGPESFSEQITTYRNGRHEHYNNLKEPSQASTTRERSQKLTRAKVAIVGDSMIKNIDNKKIRRAAKTATSCQTYCGATVETLHNKLEEEWFNEEAQYETIILHVGTNNLPHEEVDEVANKMEALVIKSKQHAKNVAVSSVINRCDNQVSEGKITAFNNSLINLCQKHNADFINNSNIDKSMLNRSNLHLNRNGDKMLGKSLCDYLKLLRPRAQHHFFGPSPFAWGQWLKTVARITTPKY